MASHDGIDFRAVPGVGVSAAGEGEIVYAGDKDDKYGLHVEIRHDNRTTSIYGHLSEITVKEGQQVFIGDDIGAVGMTGRATYPHLHFEVRIDGNAVNPRVEQLANQLKNNPVKIPDANKGINQMEEDEAWSQSLKTSDSNNESKFELQQNRPNPSDGNTVISFQLPNNNPAALYFYSAVGEFLYQIDIEQSKGHNEISLSSDAIKSTGLVYYFLVQDNMTATKTMMISK